MNINLPMNDENSLDEFVKPLRLPVQSKQRHESILNVKNNNIPKHKRSQSLLTNKSSSITNKPLKSIVNESSHPSTSAETATQQQFKRTTPSSSSSSSSNVVLIGDSQCGKTSLVLTYLTKKISKVPKSITFEIYEKLINLEKFSTGEGLVNLQIWDFPGDEYFDRFRPLAYTNAKAVLICFALDEINGMNNIKERWIPELETHCFEDCKKLIVGIGSEIRFDKNNREKIPSYDYCYKFAKSLNGSYLECSIIDFESLDKIFNGLALEISGFKQEKFEQVEPIKSIKLRSNTMKDVKSVDFKKASSSSHRSTSYKRKTQPCIIM